MKALLVRYTFLLLALGFSALDAGAEEITLGEIGLEDLMKLEVATVSRKAQQIADTPAAVSVITADDIRRSGARSVPEAMRNVPGVVVAEIGAGRYAVTIRGFNGRFSNKLLVQVDGRSVYNPFFSGVFWEEQNLVLEDIERIEVIRGPGASLWGANAVNGIISIVTRRASATQGVLVSETVDDGGHSDTAVRYGTTISNLAALRLFVRGAESSASQWDDGRTAENGMRGGRAGFRLDSLESGGHSWMLQGEAYRQKTKEAVVLPSSVQQLPTFTPTFALQHEGADLVGRMTGEFAGGEISLQAYIDHVRELVAAGKATVNTVDFDFQNRLAPIGTHEFLWGAGLRYMRTELVDLDALTVTARPSARRLHIASVFVQDEVTLQPARWKLTLGAKAEDSSLSGFELQPDARLMWTPTRADSIWAAWSRAARTPSIGEHDIAKVIGVQPLPLDSPFPAAGVVTRPQPGYEMRAERVDAFEVGYRRNLGNGSVEAVAYFDRLRRLIGDRTNPSAPTFPGTISLPLPPYSLPDVYLDRANPLSGRNTGLELGLDVALSQSVRLQAAYAWQKLALGRYDDPTSAAAAKTFEETTPRHAASLRLAANLRQGQDLDITVRYVSAVQGGTVPAYSAVDLRYSWKVNRDFELAVIGQNLFDPSHLEFAPSDYIPVRPAYQPRRLFLQGILRF